MEDPYHVENIDRLGVLMFQTSDNSQLLRRVLWINAELTTVSSLKHKNTQPIYIFNRENPQNSEPQNGPRRGLDFIALDSSAKNTPNAPQIFGPICLLKPKTLGFLKKSSLWVFVVGVIGHYPLRVTSLEQLSLAEFSG
jgi:hypothetical protein